MFETFSEPVIRNSIRHCLGMYGMREAVDVRGRLLNGRVNGLLFLDVANDCGCLLGSLASAAGRVYEDRETWFQDHQDWSVSPTGPAQHLFVKIVPGDTPENSARARYAAGVIDEWITERLRKPSKELASPRSGRKVVESAVNAHIAYRADQPGHIPASTHSAF